MNLTRPFLLASALTLLFVTALPAAAQTAAGITNGDVNLREGPGTGYGVITTVPAGASVEVLSCESWCQLRYGDYTGWASGRYIAVGDNSEPEPTATNTQPETVSL